MTPNHHPTEHRTQAERSADTRESVIQAAIACIAENGFKQATTTRIARRAGVTWGAIQHQFGDKDAILRAVMERGIEDFRTEMESSAIDACALPDRVSEFTRRAWVYYREPAFHAFLAISLSTRNADDSREFTARSTAYVTGLWEKLFGGLDLEPRQHIVAQRMALGVLIGLAVELILAPEPSDFSEELEALNDTLVRILTPTSEI